MTRQLPRVIVPFAYYKGRAEPGRCNKPGRCTDTDNDRPIRLVVRPDREGPQEMTVTGEGHAT